jgi:4-hydroxy-4-methyl-2-oxoglutarate aldolase
MESIIKQFEKIPTTCISDAMKGLNNMDPSIKPLCEEYRIAGRAFTVKTPVGDNLAVIKAYREAKPGDIVVIDMKGDTYRAFSGDFMLGMAQTLGIKGVVADGVIRDIQESRALNFPVFCKGTTVSSSSKVGGGEVYVTISCGGVAIQPGDIIVGDADGVVVIPQKIEDAVLTESLKKLKFDQQREEKISGNPDAIKMYLDELLSK